MVRISRRNCLVAAALAPSAWVRGAAPGAERGAAFTLGLGTYAMPGMPVATAVDLVAASGFDTIELAALPEWPSAPERLGAADRVGLRRLLGHHGLALSALMEHLPPAAEEAPHRAQLERLSRAAALSRDLAPDRVPLVQTVLGGGRWEEVRAMVVDRVGAWRDRAVREGFRIAVKPHRFGAMSTPAEGLWLLDRIGDHDSLGLVFDASHLVFRGIDPAAALVEAAPRVFHVAVKDAVQRDGTVGFELPGVTGTPDHAVILRGLAAAGYRGDVCCEVSGQVSKRAGYDPAAAARDCHRALRGAFAAAGVTPADR